MQIIGTAIFWNHAFLLAFYAQILLSHGLGLDLLASHSILVNSNLLLCLCKCVEVQCVVNPDSVTVFLLNYYCTSGVYTLTHCRVVIVWVTSLSLNRGQLYFIDPRKYRVHCKDVCCICSRPAPCRGKVSVMCCFICFVLKQRSIICHLCYLVLSSHLSVVFTEIRIFFFFTPCSH